MPRPALASMYAAVSPAGPAPITTTESGWSGEAGGVGCCIVSVIRKRRIVSARLLTEANPVRVVDRRRCLRIFRTVAVAGLLALGACSTPETGADDLATGRERVVDLVDEAASALPPGLAATVETPTQTGDVTCRRKFLGYAVGSAGTDRAEVPLLVEVPAGTDVRSLLPDVEQLWRGPRLRDRSLRPLVGPVSEGPRTGRRLRSGRDGRRQHAAPHVLRGLALPRVLNARPSARPSPDPTRRSSRPRPVPPATARLRLGIASGRR